MYRTLMTTFFKIGLFTFGGGYAMIPLIEEEIVVRRQWISEEEFMDIISVAQSLPGPIAVNMATMIGYRKKNLPGALMAALGVILPSFLIIIAIAYLLIYGNVAYLLKPVFLGLRPAIAILILISAYRLGLKVHRTLLNIGIFVIALVLLIVIDVHPILVILSGIAFAVVSGSRFFKAKGGHSQ